MSMSKFAAGIGAAALAAALSLPVTAMAAPAHHPMAARSKTTDLSSARRYHHHHYGHWGYRPYRYGYNRGWRSPAYAYGYGDYPYWGGPHAYVSLPFFGFSIW